MSDPSEGRRRMRRAGTVLIALGVAVWGAFAVVWLAGGAPQAGHYLPFHLSGVIPGAVLSRWPESPRRAPR